MPEGVEVLSKEGLSNVSVGVLAAKGSAGARNSSIKRAMAKNFRNLFALIAIHLKYTV